MSVNANDPHNRFYVLTPGDLSDGAPVPQYAGMSVNEDEFFDYFIQDLALAETSVEILSPYIGRRHEMLLQPLRHLAKNGVKTIVYMKPLSEMDQIQEAQKFLKAGTELGITVVQIPEMHQKLAFIDGRICWEGSLNILSHWKSAESMRRLEGKEIVSQHRKVQSLQDPTQL
jgi:hypothetical protein